MPYLRFQEDDSLSKKSHSRFPLRSRFPLQEISSLLAFGSSKMTIQSPLSPIYRFNLHCTSLSIDCYFAYTVFDRAYCFVAVESGGRQVPIAFLERVKEDFTKKYGGGKAATTVANSLGKEFGPKLKEQMN